MAIRRCVAVCAVGVVGLLAGCSNPVNTVTYGDAQLGLQGASVTLPLTVKCQSGWNLAFGSLRVTQATAERLAQGFGDFTQDFPGVPCGDKGATVNVVAFDNSPWTFHAGTAAVEADVTIYNPNTDELISRTFAPESFRIVEVTPAPAPVRTAAVSPDPRYQP